MPFNGDSLEVQRIVRRAYDYLLTEPPVEKRITIQFDSFFNWWAKAMAIAILEEFVDRGWIDDTPDRQSFNPDPPANFLPPIPDDPDAAENQP